MSSDDNKINEISKFLELNGYQYVLIPDPNDLDKIYKLVIDNSMYENHDNPSSILNLYTGVYYDIHDDDELMKKYYLMSIEQGNCIAMNNFARYYIYSDVADHELMCKYYFMAIENGFKKSALDLMDFYHGNGNTDMFLTAYKFIAQRWIINDEQDIKKKVVKCLIDFINDKMVNEEILDIIASIKIDNIKNGSFCLINQLINKQMTIFDLHFNYSVNGLGYDEAKRDFLKRLD